MLHVAQNSGHARQKSEEGSCLTTQADLGGGQGFEKSLSRDEREGGMRWG